MSSLLRHQFAISVSAWTLLACTIIPAGNLFACDSTCIRIGLDWWYDDTHRDPISPGHTAYLSPPCFVDITLHTFGGTSYFIVPSGRQKLAIWAQVCCQGGSGVGLFRNWIVQKNDTILDHAGLLCCDPSEWRSQRTSEFGSCLDSTYIPDTTVYTLGTETVCGVQGIAIRVPEDSISAEAFLWTKISVNPGDTIRVAAEIAVRPTPSAPEHLVIRMTQGEMVLHWDPVVDCTYRVYGTASLVEQATFLDSVSSTTWTDEDAHSRPSPYFYFVTARP